MEFKDIYNNVISSKKDAEREYLESINSLHTKINNLEIPKYNYNFLINILRYYKNDFIVCYKSYLDINLKTNDINKDKILRYLTLY